MKTKTCGECRYYKPYNDAICPYTHRLVMPSRTRSCSRFDQMTNGDVIRQGGDYALAHFKSEHRCDVCAYSAPIDTAPACRRPEGKSCFDGMLAYLNAPAPAESEGKDE